MIGFRMAFKWSSVLLAVLDRRRIRNQSRVNSKP